MILVRKNWWGTATLPDGKETPLNKIIIPGSEDFNRVMNLFKMEEHYEKKMIRIGSVVRLSEHHDDYFFGISDSHLEIVAESEQTIERIDTDGEIIFVNEENETHLNPEYVNYGISEIIEVIKY